MKLCLGCMEQYDDELNICPHCGFVEDTESDSPLHMQTGTILAERYIIGKVIGYGGFGVTYIAKDVLLDVKVAVKEYLPSEFATRMTGETEVSVYSGEKGEQFLDGKKKFIEEAKKLAKFHSIPGIVKIFDSFEYNNTAYIIMELLEGETLAQMLKREKKIPEEKAVEMILPVIEALSNVHKDGIIHRDIAPDNIFVTKSGDVKLIDFGAARYATTTHSRSLTVIIKPGYSPEEQYRSRGDQGPHTDVYSVAATMYKMITGQTPPDAIERRAFFENKQKDILVPMTKYVKDIEENHEIAILNALNIKIEDRTPDMDTFFTELTSMTPVKRRAGTIKKIDLMRWPLWAKIIVPSAAAVIAVLVVLLATDVIKFGQDMDLNSVIGKNEIQVKNLVGSSFDDAEKKSTGLQLKKAGKRYSDKVDENMIMYQSIHDGSVVPKNSVIKVYLSSGDTLQPVPNVVGMDKAQAEKLLSEAGFSAKFEEEYCNYIAENCVIEQSADSATNFHTQITLTISKGRDPEDTVELSSEAPDFKGMNFDKVREEAKSKNIMIKVSERKYSKDIGKNIVISQSSDSGIIELVVSLGYEKVTVPNVSDQTENDAKALLRGNGLNYKITYQKSDSAERGVVLSQGTAPGTAADPETEIELVVCSGADETEVPDVVGKSFDDAFNALSERGLAVAVSLKQDKSKTEKTVLAQSIKKGSKVVPGEIIILTISTHGEVVKMPNVTAKTQSEAEKVLKDKGFKVKVQTDKESGLKKGIVSKQSPAKDIGEAKGAEVTIWVSKGNSEEQSGSSKAASSKASSSNTAVSANNAVVADDDSVEQNNDVSVDNTNEANENTSNNDDGNNQFGNIIAEGDCGDNGDNVKYVLNESGTMYIYGSGAMEDRAFGSTGIFEGDTANMVKTIEIYDGVMSIGSLSFAEFKSLESINIANSVVRIGNHAFGMCSSLKSLYIPDSVTSIEEGAFFMCDSLSSVSLSNSLSEIGQGAFGACVSLTSITLPDSVTDMGAMVFADCNNLVDVVLSNSLSVIEESTFGNCSNLRHITIPNSVNKINNIAFRNCSSLNSITIPDSVTIISGYAFQNCTSLTEITIPENVNTLHGGAFKDCTNLTRVFFRGNVPDFSFYLSINPSNLSTGMILPFEGTSPTIYYPRNNPTWDNINEENWNGGGTPTFEPYDP